jgi:hypothetical protein
MIRFLELLISLLIVVALFVIVGLFLPSSRYIEHSLETNRPLRQVFDTINSFRRFHDWHPLRAHDPRIQYELTGAERGEGARLEYSSRVPRIGEGSLEIIESVQDERVVVRAENERYGDNKLHTYTLRERGRTVEIRWGYQVDYGWNLFGRYAGLYVTRTAGDDLRVGLGNLTGLLATMPNFDYKSLEINQVQVEPVHVLFMSLNSDRNITAVENAMVAALETLRRTITQNKLEIDGAPRLITTNFGSEKYEFDVAIPVALPGQGRMRDAAPAEAGAEVDADAEAPAVATAGADQDTVVEFGAPAIAATELAPLEGLTLPNDVFQGAGYGGRALRASYTGHPAALPLVRDMLRSFAAAHGYDVHDRAFEKYLSEIDSTQPEDAQFDVYWPIR